MKTIVKAFTGSEWDDVAFFVTEIDINELQKLDDKAHFLKKEISNFEHISVSYFGEWFNTDDNGNTPLNDTECVISEFDETLYTNPESRLESPSMKIYGDGSVTFLAFAKNTGEEFWTENVSIEKIKSAMLQTVNQ